MRCIRIGKGPSATRVDAGKGSFVVRCLCGMGVAAGGEPAFPPPLRGWVDVRAGSGGVPEPADGPSVRRAPGGMKASGPVGPAGLHGVSVWTDGRSEGLIRRCDRLVNRGTEPIEVRRCLSRFVFPPAMYELYWQESDWSREAQGRWRSMGAGAVELKGHAGRSAQGGTPFLGLRREGESHGIAFHVVPTGNWMIRCRTLSSGDGPPWLAVELGLSDASLCWRLAPGEGMDLPEILIHPLERGDIWRGAPALHRYLQREWRGCKAFAPVVYNTWFDQFEILDVDRLRGQLSAAKRAGCEVFVVDAGWYGAGSGSWWEQAGDWREKRDAAFRGRMREFAEEVRAAGLGFGLWMEAERCGHAAPVRRAHPDWFIQGASGARYDLEKPRVCGYLRREIGRLVETYGLAWMKVDFNFEMEADARGRELAGYHAAWFRLMDDMRAAYPETFFEGCSSGAMRLDCEVQRHFDGHFISDTVNPADVIRIAQGSALRLLPGRLGRWAVLRSAGHCLPVYGRRAAESPETVLVPGGALWEPAETATPAFALLAAMPGMLGLSGDLAGLGTATLAEVRRHVMFFRRWRRFIAAAACHLATPPERMDVRHGWVVLQLHDATLRRHLVFGYRLGACGAPPRPDLVGLEAASRYDVECPMGDGAGARGIRGDRVADALELNVGIGRLPGRVHGGTVRVIRRVDR